MRRQAVNGGLTGCWAVSGGGLPGCRAVNGGLTRFRAVDGGLTRCRAVNGGLTGYRPVAGQVLGCWSSRGGDRSRLASGAIFVQVNDVGDILEWDS